MFRKLDCNCLRYLSLPQSGWSAEPDLSWVGCLVASLLQKWGYQLPTGEGGGAVASLLLDLGLQNACSPGMVTFVCSQGWI